MDCIRTTQAFPTLDHRNRANPGQAVANRQEDASEMLLLVIASWPRTLVQHNIGITRVCAGRGDNVAPTVENCKEASHRVRSELTVNLPRPKPTQVVNREPEFKLNPTVATLIECGADIHAVHNIDGNRGGAPGCQNGRGAWHRALEAKNVGAMAMLRAKCASLPKTAPSGEACTSQLESTPHCGYLTWGCCVAGRDTGVGWRAGGNIAGGEGYVVVFASVESSVTSP